MANGKYSLVVCLFVTLLSACSSSAPTGPTLLPKPAPAIREIGFDINIPDLFVLASLKRTYPDGVRMSPVAAQRQFDYTAAYKGSPNVYYGEIAPHCEYIYVGIVVAPLHVATLDTFTASDWPGVLEAGFTYAWVGRFTYTAIAAVGTYRYDPTATCSTPK